MEDHEFRQVIEGVKLRIPIEDAVRERVPELKRAGALFTACCPFHDERTPSFKVDPRRGTWQCYGACGTGGDVLSFIQRFDGIGFSESLEQLSAQAGLEMPKGWKKKRAGDAARYDKLYDALERAERYYGKLLAGESGVGARGYLSERGLGTATIDAFGVGLSPMSGNPLYEFGQREGGELLSALYESGLVRKGEGRSYDFFHGRLMIPIRDARGRTVGFGGRRLDDKKDSPKYVNTPETPVFHKGRLIYGLDRATRAVRKTRHLILVEGYTDVMAAHQEGFGHVAAVLGTSTTEDHAGLVRRTGARRVTLVFDGDEAGRRATFRAMEGLLPLQLELDVLRLPAGSDPCDLFIREGASGFERYLENALDWLDFALGGLKEEQGAKLSDGVDQVLRLIERLPKPVHRESCMTRISEVLELSAESIRLQARGLAGRRRVSTRTPEAPRRGTLVDAIPRADAERGTPTSAKASQASPSPGGSLPPVQSPQVGSSSDQPRSDSSSSGQSPWADDPSSSFNSPSDHAPHTNSQNPSSASGDAVAGGSAEKETARPDEDREREVKAYCQLVGAVLIDNSLIPAVSESFRGCPDKRIADILTTILDLYENGSEDLEIDASRVMDALGSNPVREWVVPLEETARSGESTRMVAEGAVKFLKGLEGRRSISQHRNQFNEAQDEATRSSALMDIWNESRRLKVPTSGSSSAAK